MGQAPTTGNVRTPLACGLVPLSGIRRFFTGCGHEPLEGTVTCAEIILPSPSSPLSPCSRHPTPTITTPPSDPEPNPPHLLVSSLLVVVDEDEADLCVRRHILKRRRRRARVDWRLPLSLVVDLPLPYWRLTASTLSLSSQERSLTSPTSAAWRLGRVASNRSAKMLGTPDSSMWKSL